MNLLADPVNFTNFNRTDEELQLAWLFCQVVAGKTAWVQAKALERFLLMGTSGSPYKRIQEMVDSGTLLENLKASRLGQYTRLSAGFEKSLTLDLRTATVDDLKSIKGVGDKTARYFLLHTRQDQKIAVLDRHVLRHLGTLGYTVTEGTPSGAKYLELEKAFLFEAQMAKMSPADYDLMLWNNAAKKATP